MKKSEKSILAVLVLNCCILCVGHAYSVFLLVAASLALFLLVFIRNGHRLFVPIALLHIPFAQLLRFDANSFSFFSLGIILLFLWEICFRSNRLHHLPKKLVAAIAGLCLYIVVVGFFRGLIPNISMIMTLCQIIMIPLIAYHCRKKVNFRVSVYYFVTGVILACILSLVFQNYPNMKQFVEVDKTDVTDAIRICGFTGDGNRMAAQTLAAMCAVMVLQMIDKGKNLIRYVLLLGCLCLCGALTVSKMFLLEAVFLILLWLLVFFSQRGLFPQKMGMVISICIVVFAVISSGILDTQIDIYIRRFNLATDASGFTTGRTDIWRTYWNYLLQELDVLLIGNGWMAQYLFFAEQNRIVAPHSIVFELLYRLGIIGSVLLIVWMATTCRSGLPAGFNQRSVPAIVRIILAVGLFAPWLAIPAIDFDEFFFFPLLAMYALFDYAETRGRIL